MLNRTFEANKAIATAWKKEKELILEGKGTRDWTPEQQKDILETGKAHDSDGKAFEGHHMKSVEKYPEFQGDYKNIQFLSRTEHLEAHSGSFQTHTNGKYNPITKTTIEFSEKEIIQSDTIALSNPVQKHNVAEKDVVYNFEKPNEVPIQIKGQEQDFKINNVLKKGSKIVLNGAKRIGKFVIDHPVISGIIAETVSVVVSGRIRGKHSNNMSSSSHIQTNTAKSVASEILDETINTTRSSPIEHSVSGYVRHLNNKEIPVRSYTRGGKIK